MLLPLLCEIIGKGQGTVKAKGVHFLKTLYPFMGSSLSDYLDGLTKFQIKELKTYFEDNKGECVVTTRRLSEGQARVFGCAPDEAEIWQKSVEV